MGTRSEYARLFLRPVSDLLISYLTLPGVKELEFSGVERPPVASDIAGRLSRLETTVAHLAHFIDIGDRPQLDYSALQEEDDIRAQLEKQAANAKALKDNKDIEKVRES